MNIYKHYKKTKSFLTNEYHNIPTIIFFYNSLTYELDLNNVYYKKNYDYTNTLDCTIICKNIQNVYLNDTYELNLYYLFKYININKLNHNSIIYFKTNLATCLSISLNKKIIRNVKLKHILNENY